MATFEYCSDCSRKRMSLPQQTNTIWIYPFPCPLRCFPLLPLHCEITRQAKAAQNKRKTFPDRIKAAQRRAKKINSKMEEGQRLRERERGAGGGRERATATDTEVDRLMPLDGNDLIGVDWKSANQLVLHMIRWRWLPTASPTACQSQRCVCVICWQKSHFMRHKITV